ncbi:RNA polymerase sigma factor [Sandaracinobacter sp. RS1-74]|uniref:RNA polymerase sigma factor n=1 Tax=Sandaracinobacteroides sayramensis TaxID=2913411 RepID=UPI001EDC6074|nr:RNA polymerase sigma factor [Sandaracinobacteroides sayramensis]MCG2841831.1 RNA polymerase sigma factor [Sandaracinobacteroides sayramensis]
MTGSTRSHLRQVLAEQYRLLLQRLSQRLGSDSLAEEALHETWIRLGQGKDIDSVSNERGYVFRAAMNAALNLRRSRERRHRDETLDIAEEQADEAPDAERHAIGKEEIAAILRALDELSARQRDIFLSCLMDGEETELVARRHKISVRTVQSDLRGALAHCAIRLGRGDILADRGFKVSRK